MTATQLEQRHEPTRRIPRFQTFKALQNRDYRLLWISLIVSSVGTWMQIIAQSLLVLRLTRSPLSLGAVSLAQASSFFLFALIGGSVADKIDKRKFLLVTQSLSMLLALILGILTITGLIQVWMIVLLAFCSGTVLSFDQPTRSSLVPLLVPKEDLMNAISLQSVVFNGSAFIGPALAGSMIGIFANWGNTLHLHYPLIGYAGNFFLNAISFFGVLFVLYSLHVPEALLEQASTKRGPMLESIRASLGVISKDAALPWILSGYAAMLFFGPSTSLILPVFATGILHIQDAQLGILFSASGLGVILGALLVASLGNFQQKGWLLLISFFVWSISLLIFAISKNFWLSCVALTCLGIGQNGIGATTITLMQTRVPPQMRGRVMSLNTLCIMGVRPLGDFPASAAITAIGGPLTVIASASLVGGYTLFLLLARPSIHRI
ncbi:MFS transporter [Dictyobacter arantiisoli]|uniref:MFS transporter n=1 Tax=Dictyobacter arantiisoli TaxID=2014874 RepID=A0A5A5T923_9CHLR|nr:MFS transporter [Dictyobacter arantiisoli]GCF07676.1 MFS transporter [Dictyobacter arantiisoli]